MRRFNLDLDQTQLGERYADPQTAFAFQAPADWVRVAEELPEPPEDSELLPLAAFRHEQSNATCIVLRIDLQQSVSSYVSLIRSSFKQAQVLSEELRVDGVEVVLVRIIDRASIVLKAIVMEGERAVVEIDYVAPRAAFPDLAAAIDSSLASIRTRVD